MDYRSFAPGKTSEVKIPKKVSMPVRHITPKLFSALLIVLLIAGGAYGAMKWWENRQLTQNDIQSTPTPVEVPVGWKTYRNQGYGFEFRYPSEFFAKTDSGNLYTISKNDKFNYDEDAFIVSLYVDDEAPNEDESAASKKINTDIISNSIKKNVIANFSGDPPTGTYKVSIPLETGYLHIFATIGQNDDPAYNGTHANLNLFNQILSTFKFIDSAAGQFCGGIAAIQCGSGYRCQLEGDYPDAGGLCIRVDS